MKFKFLLLITLFTLTNVFTQTDGINYKAIIKDNLGNVLANTSVDVQFNILASTSQNLVYSETHTTNTDANGLVILNIGQGTTSDVFSDIQWERFEHYLNVQVDTGSGFLDMGTTEFMSVPYALHSDYANFSGTASSANRLILKDGTSTKFDLNYSSSGDKLRITETGITGSVLEIKDGEVYLPQYAGNNNGALKVDATGKVITETIPQTITFNRFELSTVKTFTDYTRLRKGIQFPDGTILSGIKALLKDNNTTGSTGVHNTTFAGLYRANKYTYNENSLLPIYRIDGSDTPTGTHTEFTQTSVAQTNANIIDNINYIYFIQVWYCNDCDITEFTIMKN
ncbi:hypothetical protein [Xanthomarina sp. GH4-25]|uniref:hypothetical protein n=1 Tax=Xanthomarina sp. GH4-25 TaxID=3349335 RepID=UPI0038781FE7